MVTSEGFDKEKRDNNHLQKREAAIVPASLPDRNVLVVEDDPFNQSFMQNLLRYWKANADISENGWEAIKLLRRKSYDLVLMDIEMPVMNGLQTIDYIRKELKLNVPVIAVSANMEDETKRQAKEKGMNDYVEKPFDPDRLWSKISNHLQHG